MSKSYKDSPIPLRPATENPIFSEGSEEYTVKSLSPMERQRVRDGSLHSMNRRTALSPPGVALFLGEDKVTKGGPGPVVEEGPGEGISEGDINALVKSFMDDDEDDADDLEKK